MYKKNNMYKYVHITTIDKRRYLPKYWSENWFQGTDVTRAPPFLICRQGRIQELVQGADLNFFSTLLGQTTHWNPNISLTGGAEPLKPTGSVLRKDSCAPASPSWNPSLGNYLAPPLSLNTHFMVGHLKFQRQSTFKLSNMHVTGSIFQEGN